MNSKEIKELKRSLPNRTEVSYAEWSEEQKRLDKELSCREMIMSCLIYGDNIYKSRYIMDYTDELGDQRVLELCKEQEKYFNEKCEVLHNVYTDSEGLSYNSLVEKEI